MALQNSSLSFLKSKPALILSGFLVIQAVLFYSLSRGEAIPVHRPLAEVPQQLEQWSMHSEGVIEQEVRDVLQADELLNRSYAKPGLPVAAHLFVAFFRSQRTGQAPHSPKNCLPGTGWVPSSADIMSIPIPGRDPIPVNRYIVSKGSATSLVLYWYQSRDRVVADEYRAKMYVVADALRYNRTDTALVRITVPVIDNNTAASEKAAIDFVQAMFGPLRQHLPA
jgi:EpsI family protein